jgi:hypothetical protein
VGVQVRYASYRSFRGDIVRAIIVKHLAKLFRQAADRLDPPRRISYPEECTFTATKGYWVYPETRIGFPYKNTP